MDTVLHFNYVTPCSEKLSANFVKILAAVVYASTKIKQIGLLIDDFHAFFVSKRTYEIS